MSTNLAFDTHQSLISSLDQKIRSVLTVQGKTRSLRVIDVQMPSLNHEQDFKAQKNAKLEGISYFSPVYATLELSEGPKVIERKKVKLFDLPQITRRGTYIVGGNEYHFPLQKRLIPGIYTSERQDGTIQSWLNSKKGQNFEVTLRDKGDFIVSVQKKGTINLLAFLRGMGVSDQECRAVWGDDVFQTNASIAAANRPLEALKSFFDNTYYPGDPSPNKMELPDLRAWIINYFENKSEFDPENVEISLGKPYSKIEVATFLDATRRILEISRGEKDEDNKESLIHNQIVDLSDYMVERISQSQYAQKINRTIKRGLDDLSKTKISQIYSQDLLQTPVESTFTQTSLSKMPKQNNFMDTLASFSELTVMGEGGISSLHQVTRDVRALDPSHFAFIDPAHTPEGENIGTTLHLASTVKKEGRNLIQIFRDVKKKKIAKLNPRQVFNSYVTFPEYWDKAKGALKPDDSDNMVRCMHRGEIVRVPPNKVDYSLLESTQVLGFNTIAVPFVSHNNGTRVMTAAKMQSQAKPLKYREPPLVQSAITTNSNTTLEDIAGANSLTRSPASGTIMKASEGVIVVRDEIGKDHSVQYVEKMWMNENNYENEVPVVKVGDKVTKGQILTDSNNTKNGKLALGINLRVAYVPYKGLNHEDGVVISETAAKKLTSLHAYQYVVGFTDQDVLEKKKFTAFFPSTFNQEQTSKIGENGVIKVGQKVKKGDPLVLKMKKIEEDTLSKKLTNISRLLSQDYRDVSEIWGKSVEGTIAEVHIRKKDVLIVIETEEEARVGDKLVGRYGNKGTITSILPDKEMPHDEDGNHMEILLDPTGTPGRMNIGQILETTASRIAEKTGKPYIARPFGGDHTKKLNEKELAENGLKDHVTLIDGDDKIEGVLAGKQYILKLEQQVEKKMSARGAGVGYAYTVDGQPSRGDGESGRAIGLGELYALLSHGANVNLSEMYTFKGDKQLEVWRAVENGTFLPPAEMPASSERFVNMLRAAGVDLVEDEKNMVRMTPFLDKDVRKYSNGVINDATVLRAKDLKEESGGLYDLKTTGGVSGDKWAHIELAEPVPHPTFEFGILAITGLKKQEFEDIISGKNGVLNGKVVSTDEHPEAKTGGYGIKELLSRINVEQRIEEIKEEAKGKKGSDLNKLYREARILKNFKDNNIKLEEMVVETMPIMPPKFRPIIEMGDGGINVADVNEHYRAAILMNNHLKTYKGRPGLREEANKVRKDLFEGMRGVMGLSTGLVTKPDIKGIAEQIAGTSPKYGYYHSKLLKRRQETSGTAVVGPGPELDMDTLGVPEGMAWKVFEPFVIGDLKSNGLTKIRAEEEIQNRTPFARDALLRVMDQKLVMMNRAPTLHKASIMAFKPRLIPGSSIKVPIEVLGGFNMDFDGDSCYGNIFYYTSGEGSGITTGQDGAITLRLNGEKSMSVKYDDLANFPRTYLIETKGNTDYYAVPEDTRVYSYDRENKTVRMMHVSMYSVHRNLSMRRIVYRSGRTIEVSDDHSLFCIDPETMGIGRVRPDDSVGMYTPRPRKIELPASIDYIQIENVAKSKSAKQIPEKIELNELFGYYIGALMGDGWVSRDKRGENSRFIGLANIDMNIIDRVQEFVTLMGGSKYSLHENPHLFKGYECFSKKAHWAFANLGILTEEWIGKGAENKHMPEFWQFGKEDFRLGLLAGLLDTDGTINYVKAAAKDKGQFQISVTTKSERMADEIVLLCASLNVRASITVFTKDKNEYRSISISSKDAKDLKLNLQHEKKRESFERMKQEDFGPSKIDSVPIPKAVAEKIRKALGAPKNATKEQKCFYSSLAQSGMKNGRMLRETMMDLMNSEHWNRIYDACKNDDLFNTFVSYVKADNILWDEVVSVEDMGDGHTAYDLTIPESLVFMLSNTIIVYDTVGIHVPTSPEAVREAQKMLPSQNLYQSGYSREKLMQSLGREYMLGVFKLGRAGKQTEKFYETVDQAINDANARRIMWNDMITVRNIGRTTAGRIKLNSVLPPDLRDYNAEFTEKYQTKILSECAKLGGEEFKKIIGAWKNFGRLFVYTSGTSFLVSDLNSLSALSKRMYAQADIQAQRVRMNPKLSAEQKKAEIIKIYSDVDKHIKGQAVNLPDNKAGKSNNIADMVASGMSKPGPDQLKQLVGTVGLMLDHRQQIIAEPVRGNYADGLDTGEFFQHMYAQRKGMIDKSRSVSGPGMLSKEITNSATLQKITIADCGTHNGKMLNVDRACLDRCLAEPTIGFPANTVVTTDILSKMQAVKLQKVKIRSVLTCEAPNGVCAHCYGLADNGSFPPIGANVGLNEIQAITERSVQLPMKSFHTGGVASAEKGTASAFDRALNVFRMPANLPNKATLAETTGKVTAIRQSGYGGWIVNIAGKDHKIGKGLEPTVKLGDDVLRGDKISTGLVKPDELLALKGIDATQDQITEDLHSAFASAGIKFNRRTHEVAARMLTEQVRIKDAGDSDEFVVGDFATIQKVNAWNKANPMKKQIKYDTILPGSLMAPMASDDWARRMALSRITQTIEEGASMGFKSDRKKGIFADLVLGPGTRIKKPGERKFK